MSVIGGLVVFVVSLFVNAFFETQYQKYCRFENIKPVKLFLQAITVSVYTIIILFFMDFLFSAFIDDSIQMDYADGLNQLMILDGKKDLVEGISEFRKIPFFIQNGVMLFIFCFFSNLIAVFSGQKISNLLKKPGVP
ncbi:hypothetical protein BH10PSE19_BH10PSE19_19370 [soil metagenome]